MAPAKEGFEDHLEALEKIVDELESGELSLDDSMSRFEEGVKHLKNCTAMLEAAEKQVKILVRDGSEEPFEEEDA